MKMSGSFAWVTIAVGGLAHDAWQPEDGENTGPRVRRWRCSLRPALPQQGNYKQIPPSVIFVNQTLLILSQLSHKLRRNWDWHPSGVGGRVGGSGRACHFFRNVNNALSGEERKTGLHNKEIL